MAARKQIVKDGSNIPFESQTSDEHTQEDKALDDKDDGNEENSTSLLSQSLSREKRRRERENKPKPKEMTEEEMMDLALRLSEQEASVNALRLQKEEEAVMKAIHESMVAQTQPCPSAQGAIADESLSVCSRRKLLYSEEKPPCSIDQSALGDASASETPRGAKEDGGQSTNRLRKRKRKEGSPLAEMPDLSQTQNIFPQDSPSSSEPLELNLDSQQSPDSTQIDDSQPCKSPVFPLTGCPRTVQVPRLSPDQPDTCRSSRAVLCSQDTTDSQQEPTPDPAQKSPTFSKSPKIPSNLASSQSPTFSDTDPGDDGETQLSPACLKSPVFGRNSPHEKPLSVCGPRVSNCNSGLMFSSQESSTSSVPSTSVRSKSPVFLRSPVVPKRSERCQSPAHCEMEGRPAERSPSRCTSPVFDRTARQKNIHQDGQEISAGRPAAELRGSSGEGTPTVAKSPSQSPRQDSETEHNPDVNFNKTSESDEADELKEKSPNWMSPGTVVTSNMRLLMSDEDDDVTPAGSPSPVFAGERPVLRANSRSSSPLRGTAGPPGNNNKKGASRSPSSSSSSTPAGPQQPSERELHPVSNKTPRGPTVNYYWGVPFCPRGLDPDQYTQVILTQMEVYEKSLKQAQRSLLRKAEWGEAILPQPEKSPSPEPRSPESPQLCVPRRLGLRRRGKRADDPLADGEEEESQREEEEGEKESKQEEENKEEGGGGGGGEEEVQVDTDDCEVCPETQLSDDDKTQDLMMDVDPAAELQPQSPEVEKKIPSENSPDEDEQQQQQQEEEEEEMEVEVEVDEAPADMKTKGSIPVGTPSHSGKPNVTEAAAEEDLRDPDVEEIIKDRPPLKSPEAEPEAEPVDRGVACPMCQGSYPLTEIEMHAAYCDGQVEDQRRPGADCYQGKLSRKRTRRGALIDEEAKQPSNTGKYQERCYICQNFFPLREYSRHTELCLQRQASRTSGKANLLSALEKTEGRDSGAGPSGSNLHSGEVIDLVDDDDDDDDDGKEEGPSGCVPPFRISNSPIRSFTPISEAAGCLVDFKRQPRTKKLSQRRR